MANRGFATLEIGRRLPTRIIAAGQELPALTALASIPTSLYCPPSKMSYSENGPAPLSRTLCTSCDDLGHLLFSCCPLFYGSPFPALPRPRDFLYLRLRRHVTYRPPAPMNSASVRPKKPPRKPICNGKKRSRTIRVKEKMKGPS